MPKNLYLLPDHYCKHDNRPVQALLNASVLLDRSPSVDALEA